jgi:hypothetical protein
MSSEQSLGTEKTSVENFTASSGTRTGTDAFGSDDAALKCRLEVAAQGKSLAFGNVAVIMNRLVRNSH